MYPLWVNQKYLIISPVQYTWILTKHAGVMNDLLKDQACATCQGAVGGHSSLNYGPSLWIIAKILRLFIFSDNLISQSKLDCE